MLFCFKKEFRRMLMTLFLCFFSFQLKSYASEFNIWGCCPNNPDRSFIKNMKAMGVTRVWCSSFGLPVKIFPNGAVAWKSDAAKIKHVELLKKFAKSGIKIVFLPNVFYRFIPKGAEQHNRWNIPMPSRRSFSHPPDDIAKLLDFYISELSSFEAFGGLVIDDEPGVVFGGDVNPLTVKLFGSSPPPLSTYPGSKGIINDDDPRLRWYLFQQRLVHSFYGKLRGLLNKSHPDTPLYLIPAANFYSGFQFASPGASVESILKNPRSVNLDFIHIRHYHYYVQYFITQLRDTDSQENIAAGLWFGMMPKGLPQFSPYPIFSSFENKRKTISKAAFQRFYLQTFAEGAKGIVFSPPGAIKPEHYKDGAVIYSKFLKPLLDGISGLHKPSGKVAILYSTSTRAIADIWKGNPINRYRQSHMCQALAYYFSKRGIPFEIIPENEINSDKKIKRFKFIIAAGVSHITKGCVKKLLEYQRDGGNLIVDLESSHNMPFAKKVDFDAAVVFRHLAANAMSPSVLEYQAGSLNATLNKIIPNDLAMAQSTSREVNVNTLQDLNGNSYVILVNNCLTREISTRIDLNKNYEILDVLSPKKLGVLNHINVTIPVGEMKIYRAICKCPLKKY